MGWMDQFFNLSLDMLGIASAGDGCFKRVNPAFCRILGWSEEDLLSMRHTDIIHPDDLARYQQIAEGITAGNLSARFESRVICKDGSIKWVSCNIASDPDKGLIYCVCRDIIEAKKAELALQESEKRFTMFMDASPAIAWMKDERGRYVYLNRACRKRFNVKSEDWLGKTDAEIHRAEIAREYRLNDLAVIDSGHARDIIEQYIDPDGTRTYWANCKFPFQDAAGNQFIAGIGIDITPLKDAEAAFREIGEKYRLLTENAADVIYKLRVEDQKCTYASPSVEKLLGYTADEVLSLSARDVLTPQSYEQQLLKLQEALARNKRESDILEIEMIHKQGHVVPVEINAIILFDDQGIPIEILGVGRDITERKRAEAALFESRSQLQKLSDNLPQGLIYQIDSGKDGQKRRFSYISGGIEQLHGITVSEALNDASAIYGQVVDEDKDFLAQQEASALSSMTPFKAEVRVRLPSGDIRWRFFSSSPRKLPDSRIIWDGIEIDVTDRKRYEQELKRLNETLEQQVAERTELARAQATQIQSLALELVQAEEKERKRIAAILHDDLQQLLAAAMLKLGSVNKIPPVNPSLETAHRLLQKSIGISRRLSHELSASVLQHFSLASALEWLFRQMDEQFGLKVTFHAETVQFEIMPLQVFLFRAAQELLFNTIKHSGVEKANVVLSDNDGEVVISVSDQGKGFDPKMLEGPTALPGMGLLNLRERVRALGGKLEVESAPGKGSRFILTVPRCFQEEK